MNRTHLVEGALLAIISLVSLAEGVRLTVYSDPYTLFDPLGPGRYILVLALGLSAVTVAHLVQAWRGRAGGGAAPPAADPVGLKQVWRLVFVLAAYVALIQFIGYVTATVLFFVAAFYVVGVTPVASALLAVVCTVCYYFAFAYYGNIIFPHGMLF